MNPRCPVCGQNLPQGLDEHEVQTQLERLTAPALARQKQRLDQDHKQRLDSQLAAFQRIRKRPVLTAFDRMFLIALRRCWSGWRIPLVYVQPDTVTRWQRTIS